MIFSNSQIFSIFLSFFLTVSFALLWDFREKKKSQTKDSFLVLMSVFFWSSFLAIFLKLFFDLLKNYGFMFIYSDYFLFFSIFLEDLIKAISLVIGLEIAGKRFNELSDGIIYTVFSIFGFLFIENLFYVDLDNFSLGSVILLSERNILSFGGHFLIVFFGFFYAFSYLKSDFLNKRPSPFDLIGHSHLLGKGNLFIGFLYILFSPFILILSLFFRKNLYKMKIGVLLFGSFFISVFLHCVFDIFLSNGSFYAFVAIFFSLLFPFVVFKRFDKIYL